MRFAHQPVAIAGAGPTGALLAILLARRGLRVTLYERRRDPRGASGDLGRSINLALADRGMHALERAGLLEEIRPLLVPMRGRFVHPADAPGGLQPYGRRPGEVIHSISRRRLNGALIDAAARAGIEVRFQCRLESADFTARLARFRDQHARRSLEIPMRPLLAADGAGSVLRRSMAAQGLIAAEESDLEHGYKELTIPAGPSAGGRLEREALHIWPRGGYMLIALPNLDGSFTATLFLPMRGSASFAGLDSPRAIDEFLSASFPDARALMPDCVAEFARNPTGSLGTVHARGWHVSGSAALVGDAAHAIVPFHGQGMNCCFEDCLQLDACLERQPAWESVFEEFYALRKPNTDAIAEMALENYREMRERVVDPAFRLQQALAHELERRHPQRFIPRYSMVMFHHEIPYRTALERGAVQAQILAELTAGADTLEQVDYARAARLIEAGLAPLPHRSSVTKL
ncbi:MAG TPA: NAD(P)/FAD-dependent oxidoreductase [Steroidobacteraceae bacterium]|nr:NAD(P)/FAD-dependent oxidoreductase [Steroidobacteraceae bacterium]